MQRNINNLLGYTIHATDGELGKVDDFFFDEKSWTIRYMVVKTNGWLNERKVLISPAALSAPDIKAKQLPVNLTREQVRNSPDIDTDQPVSRQHELELHTHYSWPMYWENSFLTGGMFQIPTVPLVFNDQELNEEDVSKQERQADPHLHSIRKVTGYHIHAIDGQIGHVVDFILDESKWVIRQMVVSTHNWWPGRKVLISPESIINVSWDDLAVFVDVTRDTVKNSPEYDSSKPLGLDSASRIHVRGEDHDKSASKQ